MQDGLQRQRCSQTHKPISYRLPMGRRTLHLIYQRKKSKWENQNTTLRERRLVTLPRVRLNRF